MALSTDAVRERRPALVDAEMEEVGERVDVRRRHVDVEFAGDGEQRAAWLKLLGVVPEGFSEQSLRPVWSPRSLTPDRCSS